MQQQIFSAATPYSNNSLQQLLFTAATYIFKIILTYLRCMGLHLRLRLIIINPNICRRTLKQTKYMYVRFVKPTAKPRPTLNARLVQSRVSAEGPFLVIARKILNRVICHVHQKRIGPVDVDLFKLREWSCLGQIQRRREIIKMHCSRGSKIDADQFPFNCLNQSRIKTLSLLQIATHMCF